MAEAKTEKIEREYVIPLREEWMKAPRYKRAAKAIRAIKEFLIRHMKVYDRDMNKIKIDKYLNEEVWFRGIRKPPHKIKVKAVKEGEIVRVELAEYKDNLKFKKAREERVEREAVESLEKKKTEKHDHKDHTHTEEKTEEKKKEEKEKNAALAETEQKMEKQEHKKTKHGKKAKTSSQESAAKKTYNMGSRGR